MKVEIRLYTCDIDPDKKYYERKIVIIFLPMCFGCTKEPSQ